MKILLIQPPYPFAEFPKPSMALMSLGAVLKREGMIVEVLDLLSTRYSPEKIEERLNTFQPDLIGTTCVSMNFSAAAKILQTCKRFHPEAITVMGGPHVTFTAEETLRNFPVVDIIVRGEGEETLKELVETLRGHKKLEQVLGLSFRQNGGVFQTEDRPFLRDLDSLPLPDRSLFPLSRYLAMRVPANVLSSRGCPIGCSFCVGYRMTGRRGRFRQPSRVVDEIEAAFFLGFEEICIDDDLFTRNRRHVEAICNEVQRRNLKLKLFIFARVDTVDAFLLQKLKEAGCVMILFGLESGNQEILDKAGKGTTLEKAREAVRLCKEAGISPFGSFILGLPGETPKTMEDTIVFARSLEIPYGFHLFSPFPGTKIRERAEDFGIRILTNDWSLYDADHAVTETAALRATEVESFVHSFFEKLGAEIARLQKETLSGAYHGPFRKEMEKRLEVDFAWKLLSQDLIEEQGEIPEVPGSQASGAGEPLHLLIERIVKVTSWPPAYVTHQLTQLSERGLIVCRKTPGCYRWKWSDIPQRMPKADHS